MKLLPKGHGNIFLKIKETDVMLSQFTCLKNKNPYRLGDSPQTDSPLI